MINSFCGIAEDFQFNFRLIVEHHGNSSVSVLIWPLLPPLSLDLSGRAKEPFRMIILCDWLPSAAYMALVCKRQPEAEAEQNESAGSKCELIIHSRFSSSGFWLGAAWIHTQQQRSGWRTVSMCLYRQTWEKDQNPSRDWSRHGSTSACATRCGLSRDFHRGVCLCHTTIPQHTHSGFLSAAVWNQTLETALIYSGIWCYCSHNQLYSRSQYMKK